jgi:hypothetical protein
MLQWQLDRIGQESRKSNFTMAERYDMDHVYYKDGTDFHGRQGYYEYPAAFSWVCGNVSLLRHFMLKIDVCQDRLGTKHRKKLKKTFLLQVLHHDLLGIRPALNADLELVPLLVESGSVTLSQPGIALRWVHDAEAGEFRLTNLAAEVRSVRVDLRGLGKEHEEEGNGAMWRAVSSAVWAGEDDDSGDDAERSVGSGNGCVHNIEAFGTVVFRQQQQYSV